MEQKKQNNRVQRQIEQTLEAFRPDPGMPHDPWFYEKLQQRLRHSRQASGQNETHRYGRVLRPALLVSLVAFNILAVIWVLDFSPSEPSGRTAYIDNLAHEYGLNIADTYLLSSDVNGTGNGKEH